MDAEAEKLQGTGWFTTDADECVRRFGASWLVTDFRAGDALFFTMHTMHMSTTNVTGLARISCDTRWQLATEPADPRCVVWQRWCGVGCCDAVVAMLLRTHSQEKALGLPSSHDVVDSEHAIHQRS